MAMVVVDDSCLQADSQPKSRSKGANSELVTVEYLQSFCLPDLLNAVEAIVGIIDNCINKSFV